MGVSLRLQKRSLTSRNIFPSTAETHDITYGDYITAHHRWPAIFPSEYLYGQYVESAAHGCLVQVSHLGLSLSSSQTHAQLSTRASRTEWLTCAAEDTLARPFVGKVQRVVL